MRVVTSRTPTWVSDGGRIVLDRSAREESKSCRPGAASRNRHDAPGLAHALELRGQCLGRGAVSRRAYSHAIQLASVGGDGRDEGGESLGCHIAHQALGILAAAEAAELHHEA